MVVEDDVLMCDELLDMLTKAGYRAVKPDGFDNIIEQILDMAPDILLLDINLPGRSGFDICREIKRQELCPCAGSHIEGPAKGGAPCAGLGADEFLTKPAAVSGSGPGANVLKRYEGRQNLIEGEGFLLDTQTYTLYIDGRSAVLPQNQGRIFETLMTSGGEVVSKEKLCEAVWGTSEYIDENALQVNLTRLKKTMAGLDMKAKIIAVRGVGYKLE